jgi:hypothetical protein
MLKICIVCNKNYNPNNGNQKCCSPECSKISRKRYSIRYEIKRCKSRKRRLWKKQYEKTAKRIEYVALYRQSLAYIQNQRKYEDKIGRQERKKIIYKKWIKTKSGKLSIVIRNQKRQEAKNNCTHSYTKEEWKKKCLLIGHKCPICNSLFDKKIHKISLDHIFPLSEANKQYKKTKIKKIYTINDVQPICLRCNIVKHNKIEEPKDLNTPVTSN